MSNAGGVEYACTCVLPLIGQARIAERGGFLTRLDMAAGGAFPPLPGVVEAETRLLRTACRRLREYLAGERRVFDLPLAPQGTPFQRGVWAALLAVPYGETRSYGRIAAAAGNPKACRAVGMACNRNPIPVIIPCHRVIGADGRLTGYGSGLSVKETLLRLEGCLS